MGHHVYTARGPIGAVLVASLLLLSAAPARAEIEVGVFGGAHFFSDRNRLGRPDNPTADTALRHSGMIGLRLAYLPIPRFGIEAEIGAIPTNIKGGNGFQATVFPLRAHLLVNLLTGRVRPFLLVGGGGQISSPAGPGVIRTDAEGAIHGGAGLSVAIRPSWGLRLDGRAIFPQGTDVPLTTEGEVLLGFFGRFGGAAPAPTSNPAEADSDGDGMNDGADRCPALAGLKENGGCPDKDSDGDGIIDRLDQCPDAKGRAEQSGCPDKDSDGDGIVDVADRCPAEAGPAEHAGCPDKDSDGDGLADRLDKCPAEAGRADQGGCPDKDGDGDGIVDRLDKCPAQPETKNNYEDNDGCPDELPKALARFTGAIQGVNFQPAQAVILASSFKVLDQAVQVLKDNAAVRLEIAGHTDARGDRQKNVDLSQKRAEAVRQYLIGKGIAEGRLKAAGYGPDKPIADNKAATGRAKNRRVEFTLLGSE